MCQLCLSFCRLLLGDFVWASWLLGDFVWASRLLARAPQEGGVAVSATAKTVVTPEVSDRTPGFGVGCNSFGQLRPCRP